MASILLKLEVSKDKESLMFKLAATTVLILCLTLGRANAALINLSIDDASDFADAQGQLALDGFQQAANYWSSVLADDVTVNLSIGFKSAINNIAPLENRAQMALFLYEDVANALIADATSSADALATSNLECKDQGAGRCAIQFLEQGTINGTEFDNNGSIDNIAVSITQANAKALGFNSALAGAFSPIDGYITLDRDTLFDFDRTDGIDANAFDFVSLAAREIGKRLGFTSSVSVYDRNNNSGVTPEDLDTFPMANTLDFYRYSSESLSYGQGTLDFRPKANSYFSLDGGQTNLGNFSTGLFGGDGYDASGWKHGQDLGLMDPVLTRGEQRLVSDLDLLAFDAIGWDIKPKVANIPEPSALVLLLLGLLTLTLRRQMN